MAVEYKVVGAPERGKRRRGARTRSERVAAAMQELIDAHAADGWEYLRTDLVPVEEKSAWTGRTHEVHRAVLVFRRGHAIEQRLPPAPAVQAERRAPQPVVQPLQPQPRAAPLQPQPQDQGQRGHFLSPSRGRHAHDAQPRVPGEPPLASPGGGAPLRLRPDQALDGDDGYTDPWAEPRRPPSERPPGVWPRDDK